MERTHEREDQSDLNATSQAVIGREAPYLKGRFGGYLLDSGVRVGDEGEEEGRKGERCALIFIRSCCAIMISAHHCGRRLSYVSAARISEGGKRPRQGEQILNL